MDDKERQVEMAAELQTLLLEDYLRLAKDGGLTATDRANLARMLEHGGWTLDPTRMRQSVKDVLTAKVDASKFDRHDADVLPFERKA